MIVSIFTRAVKKVSRVGHVFIIIDSTFHFFMTHTKFINLTLYPTMKYTKIDRTSKSFFLMSITSTKVLSFPSINQIYDDQ